MNDILLISMVDKKPETSRRIGYSASSFSRDENSDKMHAILALRFRYKQQKRKRNLG